MAEEENKEVEGKKEEKEEKKEKKGNAFSNFFKKVGKNISDANRESKIESAWKKLDDVADFEIYTGAGLLNGFKTVYGKFDEAKNEVLVYGEFKDEDIPFSAILSTVPKNADKELPKRFYVTALAAEKVTVEIEETDPNDDGKKVKNSYERPATRISLDPEVKEVEVIKVKDTYYLKKSK